MFRLMSGIFADSLHGREFCFDRLSARKCRSPRKPPPRDYVRKPPAVDLGKSSPQKIRLWELIKQGCSCPKNTVKERWFSTNQHIILGLAKVLDRPPDAVSNFLYLLTLQNFSKILNPWGAHGNHCKVPLAYPKACEDYMRLFDTHGNIRSRFDHNNLMLLMRVMQAWLRRGAHGNFRPFGPCFGAAHCTFRSGNKARRAGIDPDSIAHRNGRRRRKESDERACLIRSNLIGHPARGCPRYLYGSRNDSSEAQGSPVTSGDPGYVFGMRSVPQDLNDLDQDDHLGGPSSYEEELAVERARRLEALLFQLNARTYLTRDAYFLIEAIKGIQVERPRRKSARKSAADKSASKTISDSYYKMLRESEIRSRLKKGTDCSPEKHLLHAFGKDFSEQTHQSHDIGKDSSIERHSHRKHHSHRPKGPQPVEDSGPTNKLYYGSPIPVLMHDPYRGSIVNNKKIRRHRRSTVSRQMEKARERGPVYPMYSHASATDVPMSENKPATRKSLTWQEAGPESNRRLASS